MRILEIAPEPVFESRGTPFSVYHRTLALSRLGHRIDLVCYHIGNDVRIRNTRVFRTLRIPFIREVPIGPSFRKIFLDIFIFSRSLRLLLANRYDYIHTHEEAGLFGVIFRGLFKKKLVYDMHSSMPQQLTNFNFSKSKPLIRLFSRIERFVLDHADAVIVICPHLGDTVRKISPKKKRFLIENTPMAKDVKSVPKKDVERLRKELKIKDEKVILYTGTLEPYQGIDMLLESIPYAIAGEKNLRYLIVGGKKVQVEHFRSLARKLGVDAHVTFTGQRPIEEMDAFMGLSDVLVSPRYKGTNTPLKIYSYLKSGIPIMATDILTHTQVLDSSVAVLAKPSPEDFGKMTLELIRDKSLQVRLGKNAKRLAETKYSYEQFLEKTKNLCDYIEKTSIRG